MYWPLREPILHGGSQENGKYSIGYIDLPPQNMQIFGITFQFIFTQRKKNSQEVENESEINFQFMYIKILFITDSRRDTKISYIQVKAI